MNFSVSLGNSSSQYNLIINASSWSNCLAYCEGTGDPIIGIQSIPNAIINYNVSGTTNCYQISARNAQGEQSNHYVWETDFNSFSTWVENQSFSQIINIQNSNKTYVVV